MARWAGHLIIPEISASISIGKRRGENYTASK